MPFYGLVLLLAMGMQTPCTIGQIKQANGMLYVCARTELWEAVGYLLLGSGKLCAAGDITEKVTKDGTWCLYRAAEEGKP